MVPLGAGVGFVVAFPGVLLSRCCLGLSDLVLEVVKACHGVSAGSVFAVLMYSGDASGQSRCESSCCTDRADELLRLCVCIDILFLLGCENFRMKNPCSTSSAGTTGVSYLGDSIFSYVCWSELRRPDCHYCSDQNGGLS